MKSRNSLRRFGRACAITSVLLGAASAQQTPPAKPPAFAVADTDDLSQWQTWAGSLGWRVLAPTGLPPDAGIDARVLALAAAVRQAAANGEIDPDRVYLAGRGESAAAVFYAASRSPDVWAAAVAVGGTLAAALDTNRIFAANFGRFPVLWAAEGEEQRALAAKLNAAGIRIEFRPAAALSLAEIAQWLAGKSRPRSPSLVDCETTSEAFGSCYWVRMMAFDANARNDVLPLSLVRGEPMASLDLGPFEYAEKDPGPGILVTALPPKYNGPLKEGDRIISVDGKPLADARAYQAFLRSGTEEKSVGVMVQRGKERKRIETRVVPRNVQPFVSARVQARYVPEDSEIQIVSRMVTRMQVTVPPEWLPVTLYWNGLSMQDLNQPGCIALRTEQEILRAEKCP